MASSKKSIGLGVILAISLLVLVLVGIATVAISYISANNDGARMENQINQLNKDSENKLSKYTLEIGELIQVPEMYKNDLKEVITATFSGRYGPDGSKAVMQWIQERNLNFDSSLYKNIQIQISAGRKEFEIAQTRKLEQCTVYENNLAYFWKGMWLNMAGYPKRDLAKLCQVVSDTRTQASFERGTQESIKLR